MMVDVYETFNAAMEIGTPNVFKVYEEDGVCKIIIAKEKGSNMELPPFILRPISGPCVQKYQKFRQQQRREKMKQNKGNMDNDNDEDSQDEDDQKVDQAPKQFKNSMSLAQPKPLNKKD